MDKEEDKGSLVINLPPSVIGVLYRVLSKLSEDMSENEVVYSDDSQAIEDSQLEHLFQRRFHRDEINERFKQNQKILSISKQLKRINYQGYWRSTY